MGYKLEQAPDKIDRGISFIIYANPGIGKTTLATTLPSGENKTLIINTEAGLGPLLGTKHVVLNVKKIIEENPGWHLEKVVTDIYQELRTGKLKGYQNVVLDNVSELLDLLVQDYTQQRTKNFPELKEHGDVSYKMKEWLHNFRDLIYLGKNVVFNAWETQMEIRNTEGTILTKTVPMIGRKLSLQACGIVDVVGHLDSYEKTGKRWIRFGPSQQFLTKSQFKGLDNGEPPDLPAIITKLKEYDYGAGSVETQD